MQREEENSMVSLKGIGRFGWLKRLIEAIHSTGIKGRFQGAYSII